MAPKAKVKAKSRGVTKRSRTKSEEKYVGQIPQPSEDEPITPVTAEFFHASQEDAPQEVEQPAADDSPAPAVDTSPEEVGEIATAEVLLEGSEANESKRGEIQQKLQEAKAAMRKRADEINQKQCRYDFQVGLPRFEKNIHIPLLGLLNPRSGSKAGMDVLAVAWRQEYYQDYFFDIINVVSSQKPGGYLDLFRIKLNEAKEEAKKMKVRPRLITGGGDGTCSFGIFIVFLALQAHPDRADEGLADRGNGFIWTDEELELYFPAFVQMPLGSGNDLANFMGWGKKYPGDGTHGLIGSCRGKAWSARKLSEWIGHTISKDATVANFDVWGLMPADGEECNFKLCELAGRKGYSPKVRGKLQMRPADNPVPFFIVLYANIGWLGYEVARFQINRRSMQFYNDLEHTRQAVASFLEFTPRQMTYGTLGCTIVADGEPYFPPRGMGAEKGRKYLDVGFMNINSIVGGHVHAADRVGCCKRFCACISCSYRQGGPQFNDGQVDLWRIKGPIRTTAKNPGTTMQCDKKSALTFSYEASKGQGVFMQYDGESRFMFSPTGDKFSFTVRKALNIPMVLGPGYNKACGGDPDNGKPVTFYFGGDDEQQVQAVKQRIWRLLAGKLKDEMLASTEELRAAEFPVDDSKAS